MNVKCSFRQGLIQSFLCVWKRILLLVWPLINPEWQYGIRKDFLDGWILRRAPAPPTHPLPLSLCAHMSGCDFGAKNMAGNMWGWFEDWWSLLWWPQPHLWHTFPKSTVTHSGTVAGRKEQAVIQKVSPWFSPLNLASLLEQGSHGVCYL